MAVQDSAQVPSASFEAADRSLRKTMGFNHLLFLSVTALIGSGWLFGAIAASGVAGPAAILSWIIGGVFVIFIAVSYMEVAGMLPRSGAIVRYPHLTHGGYAGWMLGWAYWLSAITVPAIEAEAAITYLGGRFPGTGLLTTQSGVPEMAWPQGVLAGIGLMVLFFVLNYFGVRLLSETNRWITWWKIIVPSLTAIFLFTIISSSNYSGLSFGSAKGFFPYGTASIFGAISTTGILFSYLGFRQALDYAGEAKNPQKHVPLATILSVLIAIVIYVAIQIGFTGAINWHNAGVSVGDWAALVSAKSTWAASPLVSALGAAGVGWLVSYTWVLVVDAGISPAATGWVYLGTSGRTNYGLSVNGNLPKAFQRSNRWGIPWLSMIVAAVIGCLFFIPAPSWYKLVGFISAATALTYIMGGIGTIVLRRHAPDMHRPFRLPAAWVLAPIGFMAAWMVVYWSGYATLVQVYAAVFIGLPIFVWHYAPTKGWFASSATKSLAAGMGVVFLGAWVYIEYMGGWLLRVSPPASGSWGFIVYYVAQTAAVLFFCGVLWLLSNRNGRKQVERGMWFVVVMFALLPVSYYGGFGPEASSAPLAFPWGTIVAIALGLIAFGLGVASGYKTEELSEITALAAASRAPAQAAAGPETGGEAAPA